MKLLAQSRLPIELWLALWLCLAALVGWQAWPGQLERGCWMGEWPFENGCDKWPDVTSRDESPEIYQRQLQANIGDSHTYAKLVRAWWLREDVRAVTLLAPARQLAPFDVALLSVQATLSAQQGNVDVAARTLVEMVERGSIDARKPLMALMLEPSTQNAVLEQINANSRWLDGMLMSIDPKVPPSLFQQFVSQGQALGILRINTVLNMVERLKRSGDWMDAYTLWVTAVQKVDKDLNNPGFDQRSLRRGFDWEWQQQPSNKQGVRVSQVPASPRQGSMLEVELTGRAALPQALVGQTLLLLGDSYQLKGRYMSDRIRSKQGLAWVLRCGNGGNRWAQTRDLLETQRQWHSFEISFKVPAECNGAVRLNLEASAPWEARAGISGIMYFDDFELSAITTASVND